MKYKLSRYNVIFVRNDKKYLWNTLTGALIKLDDDGEQFLESFNSYDCSHKFFEPLLRAGCIVDDRYNELGKILVDEKSAMLNPAPISVHFTIAPGLGCNYNCPYCFEKSRRSHLSMSKETQDKVCEYIIDLADKNTALEYIGVTWFGGEPLMYSDAIDNISRQLISYCEKRQINYGAGIVTNGRLLNKTMAEMLVRNKVTYVQLSMDGTDDYYAAQKGATLLDYEATVQNIVEAADVIPITVRINVTDSLDEAIKLTEHLLKVKDLDGKIKMYVAHVRDYNEKCMLNERLSHNRFMRLEKTYMSYFLKDGRYSKDSLFYVLPERRTTTCLSVCGNNFCIGPEGEFYRCEHFFGNPDYVVGNIQDGRFYSEVEVEYLKHMHPEKCENCKMFPVCLGGCMNDNKDGDTALSCEDFKTRLIDYIVM